MSGLPQKGTLQAVWGDNHTCQAAYQLPQKKGPAGVYALKATCSGGKDATPRQTAAPAATEGTKA